VYWCLTAPIPTPYFLVRTRSEPMTLARSVRIVLKEVEPLRSVYELGSLEARLDDAYRESRVRARLLAFFAVAALLLAAIGLYGTLSYVVGRRRREVGLRLALGAARGTILGQFLGHGLFTVGIACAAGLAASLAFGRVLEGMLYGVSPYDAFTLSAVVAVVLTVGAAASLVPAIRAAHLDPMLVLREE
jgi:ABC-type lipoprotein release transport system permease subunit